jgi:GNAT superfamily N-acetyltransferase
MWISMTTQYYKRFRMEYDLTQGLPVEVSLPIGYACEAWQPRLIERHAWSKLQSFREEVDATVFECLGDYQGCLRLMRDIAQQPGFLPQATWLITHRPLSGSPPEDCGTIQAVAISESLGSIQNVGVTPSHRGLGLGRGLVYRCLEGCLVRGLKRVALEVTANNVAAVALYRRMGFRVTRTMFRSVDPSPLPA